MIWEAITLYHNIIGTCRYRSLFTRSAVFENHGYHMFSQLLMGQQWGSMCACVQETKTLHVQHK